MEIADILRPYSKIDHLNPLVAGRWSSRAFDPVKEVPADAMERLFEAARWAPSAMNNQPWRFMSFGPEDSTALKKARSVLYEGNAWALSAPRLIFVLSRNSRTDSAKPNIRAQYETGMAAAQMALQAAEEGLAFHQMAGFDSQRLRELFFLPDLFQPIVAIAIGYPGSISSVPENKRPLETAERKRLELSKIVFSDGECPEI